MPVLKSRGSEGKGWHEGVWFVVKRKEKQAEVSALELGLRGVVVENRRIQSRNGQAGRENIAKT